MEKTEMNDRIDSSMFSVYEVRYTIDADELKCKRLEHGVKQETFAVACGWSRSYQQKLENGAWISVSEETARIISDVLKRLESSKDLLDSRAIFRASKLHR